LLSCGPAFAGPADVQAAYASATEQNCNQFANIAKAKAAAAQQNLQNSQAAILSEASLGAACLTNIENAINSIIPATTLAPLSSLVANLIHQVEAAVLGAACQVVYNKVTTTGQMVSEPINNEIGSVNGAFTGTVNNAVSGATGGEVPSTGVQGPIPTTGATVNLTNAAGLTTPQFATPSAPATTSTATQSSSGGLSGFWNSVSCGLFHSC
jgi:hypothetical protein